MTNLENIKLGEKYTLLIENTMGFIVSRQVKITEAYLKDYAQYKNRLHLHYILKGKRKAQGTRYVDNKIAIIEGWQEIKGIFLDKIEKGNKVECFANEIFEEILIMNKLTPVYAQNVDLSIERKPKQKLPEHLQILVDKMNNKKEVF